RCSSDSMALPAAWAGAEESVLPAPPKRCASQSFMASDAACVGPPSMLNPNTARAFDGYGAPLKLSTGGPSWLTPIRRRDNQEPRYGPSSDARVFAVPLAR